MGGSLRRECMSSGLDEIAQARRELHTLQELGAAPCLVDTYSR